MLVAVIVIVKVILIVIVIVAIIAILIQCYTHDPQMGGLFEVVYIVSGVKVNHILNK